MKSDSIWKSSASASGLLSQWPDAGGEWDKNQRSKRCRAYPQQRMHQHQLGQQLQDNRHHAKTAHMRIGHHRQKPLAVFVSGATGVGQIRQPIQMQCPCHPDPRRNRRQGGYPAIGQHPQPGRPSHR